MERQRWVVSLVRDDQGMTAMREISDGDELQWFGSRPP